MAGEQRSLRTVYTAAEQDRRALDNHANSASSVFQEKLITTIQLYEECLVVADRIALFSPNEGLEDVSSSDLQYLLLHYHVAELVLRMNGGIAERKQNLLKARTNYESYLTRLDDYGLLSKIDVTMFENYRDSPDSFSTASTADAAQRRQLKIQRFKEEKALRQSLDYLSRDPSVLQNDEGVHRELQLARIAYSTHQTFQSIESIAQELHIISLAPPSDARDERSHQRPPDSRERSVGQSADSYSERLESRSTQQSAGLRGPLLDSKGKPLRPFTLTSTRQDLRAGVFRPDHSLPTMSIDEYLEEERRRGGIIEGGGPASGIRPEIDEDDIEAADAATMKAREWDEFTEANPRGSGNTLNRG